MEENKTTTTVVLRPQGPVVIKGHFIITDEEGKELEKKEIVSICRCTHSKNMPFCDGSHKAFMR
jgi:CDGSH-type Zn-finger protein